ncbi:ATP-binding protein [Paludicola sp. MB14-C6]|uniref:ATP-binding protein n=1 Tax=Paludihabitans sp. MB14-C6 TaxID=3070656 RepID=UPI0027DB75AC|nr:ATP-binding protein [Paludicola sp. MB14-C6]WMJ23382.1 ATP-binding protein [Paludicola sp. MB14-C6]
MANENFMRALKIISQREQKARRIANQRYDEVCLKIPYIKDLYQKLALTSLKVIRTVFNEFNTETQITSIKNENLAIQNEIKDILIQNGYTPDYLDTHFYCSQCDDTGYVDGVKCSCLTDVLTELNVQELNKRTTVSTSNFQNFYLKYYSDIPDERTGVSPKKIMSNILDFCTRYAQTFSIDSPSVLMIGETGLGKTHLSLAIADTIAHKGYRALYVSSLDLFRTLQDEYFGKGEDGANTMQTVLDADLIIIDDLGAEFESQFNTSSLYNIINSRLNLNKPTIINTNLMLNELDSRYNKRVASRLMTLYKCLKFVGKDIRQIKLKNNEI